MFPYLQIFLFFLGHRLKVNFCVLRMPGHLPPVFPKVPGRIYRNCTEMTLGWYFNLVKDL